MSAPNWWGDWRPTLTPHTGNLLATDLIECTMIVGGLPVNTVITGAQILGAVPSGGLTVGTTAIASGTVGRVLFQGTGNVLQQSANLFWDNTNNRLGIGGTPGAFNLDVNGTARVSGLLTTPAGTNLAGWYLYANGTTQASMFGGTSWILDTVLGGGYRFRTAGNVDRLRIESSGNVLIGTSTDAGFKLDVNGTARVQGKLSVNTPTAASAVMEVTSTTQGFLPPRMTNAQMLAIAAPAAGLVVYDTTNNKHCGYNGTAWQNFY